MFPPGDPKGLRSWPGGTYLLQSVIRRIAEAVGAALQPAGPRHGVSLLIQQHLSGRKTHGKSRRRLSPQQRHRGMNHHDHVPCMQRKGAEVKSDPPRTGIRAVFAQMNTERVSVKTQVLSVSAPNPCVICCGLSCLGCAASQDKR